MESWQSKENVLPSANSLELADSSGKNAKLPKFNLYDSNQKLKRKQEFNHLLTETKEAKQADLSLSNDLDKLDSMFGDTLSEEDLSDFKEENQKQVENISVEDEIKQLNIELKNTKISPEKSLRILITRFEGEESVSLWVENWKNFLRLHDIANSKSPKEKGILQNIITKADFSSETAFADTLNVISKNTNLSVETRKEILTTFNSSKIASVADMDRRLKDIKAEQKLVRDTLSTYAKQSETLESEVKQLKVKLERLPLDDPDREKLEKAISNKSDQSDKIGDDIKYLEAQKRERVSFELREGFEVILNTNGSRVIKIHPKGFRIALPSNRLPFQGRKNIRSINTAFVFKSLAELGMSDILFSPSLNNKGVPSKQHRDTTHLILKSLGYNDDRILSQSKIIQLHRDLNRLKLASPNGGGKERLTNLGIYEKHKGKIDVHRFNKVLLFTCENRRLSDDWFFNKLDSSNNNT